MKTKTLLLSLLAVGLGSAAQAQTFSPTTIVDGQFARGTHWYTMRIGNNQKYITDNGTASFITLNATTKLEDADLWCITDDPYNGSSFYNKQAGPTKVLASSTTMQAMAGYGGTGGNTYPTLQPVDALPAGYVDKWDMSPSNEISGIDGCFIMIHGTNYAMNDFAGLGKLAFWAEGQDAGSTVSFELAEAEVEISTAGGTFTSSNPAKTWHAVWESSVVSGLKLSTGQNNMTTEDRFISGASGTSHTSTYTIMAPDGFIVAGYSFDLVNNKTYTGTETLTIDGKQYTSSATEQHVEVTGLKEATATFVQTGSNKCVTLKNFFVLLRKSQEEPEPQQNLYITNPGQKPYRIPAIATAPNGDIFAISDYRPCGNDIGYGEVDIKCRISKDNGQTWGDEFFVADGLGETLAGSENWKIGFGDAAIVCDRERNELLVMSVCGKVVCWNGNYIPDSSQSNPNHVARTRATYNEATGEWEFTAPELATEGIYRLFVDENNQPTVQSLFIGSGRIAQSRIVKVKDYYRLYCAVWTKNEGNRVIYSDDFGQTWHVLGTIADRPAPGGDEPKCEELPDGSVLLSSRVSGGRYFNIYTYTDPATGKGAWSNPVKSETYNHGIAIGGNSTNGEVMLIPAVRREDGKHLYLLLQSVPFGDGRSNVGIYYKELDSFADFSTPTNIAKDWDGRHQSTALGSAYSTMTWQKDNTLGFLYEEETFGAGYTIVYKNYSIEQITDSTYAYDPGVVASDIIIDGIDCKAEGIETGTMVGQCSHDAGDAVSRAIETYKADPTQANYDAINATLANLEKIEIVPFGHYRLRNTERSSATLYLQPEATRFTAAATDLGDADQIFSFIPAETDDAYLLYNENYGTFLGPLTANETQPVVTADPAQAGVWVVRSALDGKSQMVCRNNTGTNKGLHLAGDNTRLVPWTPDSPASQWYIEPVDSFEVVMPESGTAGLSLPFDFTAPEGYTVYTTGDFVVVDDVICVKLEEVDGTAVPAGVSVLLQGEAGALWLTTQPNGMTDQPTPLADDDADEPVLRGTLAAATVEGDHVYRLDNSTFRPATSNALPANTVYLTTTDSYDSLPLTLREGFPVGIGRVETDSKATRLYDLNGRRVTRPGRGIYVTGEGQKVLVP